MEITRPLSIHSFPQAIIHVDGDAFFASCEQAMNPSLKGKCVVTGSERGIASAMSYEAKGRGVTRGMSIRDIRKVCPEAIILPSNYEAYSLYAIRMYEIVRRYTPSVEEYSIDECFADIRSMRRVLHKTYEQIAELIKIDLERELGITFSLGLAPTKVLAKVASKWNKPSGLTIIKGRDAHLFLAKTKIEDIWGIGPQTSSFLIKHGIVNAYQFASKNEEWVNTYMSKPYKEIYLELRAIPTLSLNLEVKKIYKSISKTKTFTPPSNNKEYVFSQLSKNIENACIKARRHHLKSKDISIFIKTNEFRYRGADLLLSRAVNTPMIITDKAREIFEKIFDKNKTYRGSGIVLKNLVHGNEQLDLFGEHAEIERFEPIFASVDEMSKKYGKHTLFLGSSFGAHSKEHINTRELKPKRYTSELFKGENKRKHISIPFLGKVE